VIGYRESPGRPGLYATTTRFLDELGLKSLSEMPPLEGLGETLGSDLQQPELVPAMDAETLAPPTPAVIAAGS